MKTMSEQKNSIEKNFSYTIPDGPHAGKTLWSGRYTAVVAVVLVNKTIMEHHDPFPAPGPVEKTFVLVSKRGSGTPNYQGCWNIQCGFLEGNETGEQGCSRETYEETGVTVPSSKFKLWQVRTDPSEDKNVSIRYIAVLDDFPKHNTGYKGTGGEANEVDEVMWLDIYDTKTINSLDWAFNHKNIIKALRQMKCNNELFSFNVF